MTIGIFAFQHKECIICQSHTQITTQSGFPTFHLISYQLKSYDLVQSLTEKRATFINDKISGAPSLTRGSHSRLRVDAQAVLTVLKEEGSLLASHGAHLQKRKSRTLFNKIKDISFNFQVNSQTSIFSLV